MLFLVFHMTACGFVQNEYDEMELTEEDIRSVQQSPIPVATANVISDIETISIYTIDTMEYELVPVKVRVNSEYITPQYIMEEVLRNLEAKVEVVEIGVENKKMIVTFSDQYAPIVGCSARFETLLLDCISSSLLDNISYIDEVIFRCPDGAYKSEHFSFGEDEVYSSK